MSLITFLKNNKVGIALLFAMWFILRPILMVVGIPYTHNIQIWLKQPAGCTVLKSRHVSVIWHVATYKRGDKSLVLLTGDIPTDESVPSRWEEFNLGTGQSRDVYLQPGALKDKLVEFQSADRPAHCESINSEARYFNGPVFIGPRWNIATLLNSRGVLSLRLLSLGEGFRFIGCDGGKLVVLRGGDYGRVIVCPLP